jgi:S-adenosylmethionine:tRNA ribosyltransferase-isomerase
VPRGSSHIVFAAEATSELKTDDFAFHLPSHLIAQQPLERRDASRLLVLDRSNGAVHHSHKTELGFWLAPGDLLVANNSRVFPARLRGFRLPSGGAVEVLLLRVDDGLWRALAKPSRRLKIGTVLEFPPRGDGEPARARVDEVLGGGEVSIRFEDGADARLHIYGEIPLPPYISARLEDAERYQTVYNRSMGSAAAPTAGLHFTDELIAGLKRMGIGWTEVTLHVGLDTFRPVSEERIVDHKIHREWCEVSFAAAEAVARCRRQGGRVVAVGTTAARTLETLGQQWRDEAPRGFAGFSDIFIVPGHRWRLVDALLTNFHLPRSTLLVMVSALAGRERILEAYDEEIRRGYRFFSFGDAMLIR